MATLLNVFKLATSCVLSESQNLFDGMQRNYLFNSRWVKFNSVQLFNAPPKLNKCIST